jgi:hypothetical protein
MDILYYAMSELLKRIRKNSTIPSASILKSSKYFDSGKLIKTRIPLFNLALSGKLDGGLPSGIIQIAAPPKHFKTKFLHELMYAFQENNKGEDYFIVLYDSELGSTLEYYEKAGLDTTRIDHRPIKSVEELKSDIANLLNDVTDKDKIFICIDSIGMLRSNKETLDAIDGKTTADMTRAKELNSLFRIITAESAIKQIPIAVINHSYQTLELYSKEVASGGRKTQYAAHSLFFITKAQEKEDKELKGFTFTLRAGLSRYVKENSTFPILVFFDEGIYRYSGMFDLALEFGFVKSEKQGWYVVAGDEKQKRRADIEEDATFIESLLANADFCAKVEAKYSL